MNNTCTSPAAGDAGKAGAGAVDPAAHAPAVMVIAMLDVLHGLREDTHVCYGG